MCKLENGLDLSNLHLDKWSHMPDKNEKIEKQFFQKRKLSNLRIENKESKKATGMTSTKILLLAANPLKPHFLLSVVFAGVLIGMVVIQDINQRALLLVPALILYLIVFVMMLFESQMLSNTVLAEVKSKIIHEEKPVLPKPVRPGA